MPKSETLKLFAKIDISKIIMGYFPEEPDN
jgi:hypothetical protein